MHNDAVVAAVDEMYAAFTAAPLPLRIPGSEELSDARERVLRQFDDYVFPRLDRIEAPPVVVVGGPTGVGKSTLVNSMIGEAVARPGMLRPTTRSPVLVLHPEDEHWFAGDRVLGGLPRTRTSTDRADALHLVPTDKAPRGLALIDAPDFDSIEEGNRALALRLLDAADVWLFVTSASRYSDLLPWEQLDLAIERNTPVVIAMNRIPDEDHVTVTTDLMKLLRERDVPTENVYFVAVGPIGEGGMLPAEHVRELRGFLDDLARSPERRHDLATQAVTGALRSGAEVATSAAGELVAQVDAVGEMLSTVDAAFDTAKQALLAAACDGSLLRGDLLARWQELIGTDDLDVEVGSMMGLLRERLRRTSDEQRAEIDRLGLALDVAIETLVVDHAERAAEASTRTLKATTYGDALLSWTDEDLARPSRELPRRIRRETRAWREGLDVQVAEATGETTGRPEDAARVRALAVACVVRAVTTDRTSATGLIASVAEAVDALLVRLLDQERARYFQPVLGWGLEPDAPARLRRAAANVARLATDGSLR
ncbi:GTPase domain-containing protein [Nocardioides montaniterrae]